MGGVEDLNGRSWELNTLCLLKFAANRLNRFGWIDWKDTINWFGEKTLLILDEKIWTKENDTGFVPDY